VIRRIVERRFTWLLGSSRHGGNSETLARAAAATLPDGVHQTWLHLADLPLPQFADIRHEGDGTFPPPRGNERILFDATVEASDVVIVSPVYWYSVSALVKHYLDYWTAWMRVGEVDFRGLMASKALWGVTVTSDDDLSTVEPLIGTLRLSAEYFGMAWGGVLIGYGNRPGDVAGSLDEAATFFERAGTDRLRLA
jgi:multimeric flavodoxin WrbA